ncbi:hypothetical protein DFH09DRAFT_1362419 [Mycena vulgaris]|nr:hypothetical protein DFH09DRAFT_1362419 [Mycena vulgaris]
MVLDTVTQIPPELTDHIIDYFWDSAPDLRVCGLVCKGWVASSRHHLFDSIVVADAPRFLDLLQSPSKVVATHTHALDLRLLPSDMAGPTILSHLPTFLQLTSLTIGAFLPSLCDFPCLPQVTKLALQHAPFPSSADFTRFVSAFPSVRELEVAWVSWADAGHGVLPRLQLDLDVFSLKGFQEHTDVLPWLLCAEHSPHTRALSLYMPNNATAQTLETISKYLRSLDGHLVSLTLDLHPSLYLQRNVGLLGLDRLRGLRHLRVAHGIYFHPEAAACRAFGGIMDIVPRACRTSQLDELTFDVDITYPDGWFSGSVTALKGVLEDPAVGMIKSIRFNVLRRANASADGTCYKFRVFMREAGLDRAFVYMYDK